MDVPLSEEVVDGQNETASAEAFDRHHRSHRHR